METLENVGEANRSGISLIAVGAISAIIGLGLGGIFAAAYFLSSLKNVERSTAETAEGPTPEIAYAPVSVHEVPGPSNWFNYFSDEWNVGFKFPEGSAVEELNQYRYLRDKDTKEVSGPVRRLSEVKIGGPKFTLTIVKGGGSGVEGDNWTHPAYTISGIQAKTWQRTVAQANGSLEIEQLHSIQNKSGESFVIKIEARDSTQASDQILSTLKFF